MENKSNQNLDEILSIFSGGSKVIHFTEPILDLRGKENERLILSMHPYVSERSFWMLDLFDEEDFRLGRKILFPLKKPITEYADRTVNSWQKKAERFYCEAEQTLAQYGRNGRKIKPEFFMARYKCL